MFTLPIRDILMSYEGDTKKIAFSGSIYEGYFPDIIFLEPLMMTVTLRTGNGKIFVSFENIETTVGWKQKEYHVHISECSTIFSLKNKKNEYPIDQERNTIDLSHFLHDVILARITRDTQETSIGG